MSLERRHEPRNVGYHPIHTLGCLSEYTCSHNLIGPTHIHWPLPLMATAQHFPPPPVLISTKLNGYQVCFSHLHASFTSLHIPCWPSIYPVDLSHYTCWPLHIPCWPLYIPCWPFPIYPVDRSPYTLLTSLCIDVVDHVDLSPYTMGASSYTLIVHDK